MTVTQDAVGRRVVLSPQEGLVAGGPAEEFEQRVQALFRNGSTDLLVDLRQVPTIDSRGVRALVRAHTTAQRLGATFRIACPCPAVRTILEVSKLDHVFVVYDTLDAAQKRDLRWDLVWTALAGGLLCTALVAGGLRWPLAGNPDAVTLPIGEAVPAGLAPQPFIALIKLVAAALIGMLVTAIHAPSAADRPTGRAMQHAQILLCVSGAMMMIIIGNSLARAFGIAGAASIVRFRTPVEDPKDVTIIFLLMSLGMACGLGRLRHRRPGRGIPLRLPLCPRPDQRAAQPRARGRSDRGRDAISPPITCRASSPATASSSRRAKSRRARKPPSPITR